MWTAEHFDLPAVLDTMKCLFIEIHPLSSVGTKCNGNQSKHGGDIAQWRNGHVIFAILPCIDFTWLHGNGGNCTFF